MSAEKRPDGTAPKEIDVFVTLRHLDADGKEIFYTGEHFRGVGSFLTG